MVGENYRTGDQKGHGKDLRITCLCAVARFEGNSNSSEELLIPHDLFQKREVYTVIVQRKAI